MHTERIVWPEGSTVTTRGWERAIALLRGGACVAFPTETVYGLGARYDDEEAVRKIFAAKGRPADKPLIVHVLDEAGAREVAGAWPQAAATLAHAFWPGPVTLVVPRGARVSDTVAARGVTVAIRATSHPVARALIAALGLPIAAPSANPTDAPPPVTADEVMRGLSGRIPLVIDGGPTPHRTPSTLVDTTVTPCRILREGAIARDEIATQVALV